MVSVIPPRYNPAMVSAPGRKPATYADVLAAPAHVVAEVLDGELVQSPRPAPRHATPWRRRRWAASSMARSTPVAAAPAAG